jgi:lycopene beta-cyclase
MAVRWAERSVVADCRDMPYQMLASVDFYAEACRLIGRSPVVSLMLDTECYGEAQRTGDCWRVDTDRGPMTATAVVDTRPPPTKADDALLWQSFSGQEVSCSTAPFDPSTVELMNFAPPHEHEVGFTYVLPMTPERALVESTVFSPRPVAPASLAQRQAFAVDRHCAGRPFEVQRSENGVLPMGWRHPRPGQGGGATRGGVRSGGARPASGYAFVRIQRWAHAAAAAIRSGRAAPPHRADPPLTRTMDRLLLEVLRKRPELGPQLFLDLFSRADPRRVVRFLSDQGTLADHAAMVAALPARRFLGALLARRRGGRSAGDAR